MRQAVVVEGLPIEASVQRGRAPPLEMRLIALPTDKTDTEAAQCLGDGTLYRLELDRLGTGYSEESGSIQGVGGMNCVIPVFESRT